MTVAKNHLPAELAASLLERERATVNRDQCLNCRREILRERARDGSGPQVCVECGPADAFLGRGHGDGIPLAYPISDDIREILQLLTEEAAEAIQAASKIQRFGMTTNPWTGLHNRAVLESELGDVFAAVRTLHALNIIDWVRVCGYADAKLKALREPDGRLRIAKVPEGA